MKIYYNNVKDSILYILNKFEDNRGSFQEIFSKKHFPQFECLRINCSKSKKNVLRGLHISSFGKLVYCVKGSIFDVVADFRKDSETYLKWDGFVLNEENNKIIYIPPNCGHGFLSLQNDATIIYAQNGLYDPKKDISIRHDDPNLKIEWPGSDFVLSDKDRMANVFSI